MPVNLSAFEGGDQSDVTKIVDKMFCSIGLVTNDSCTGVISINPVGQYSKYSPLL